MLRATIAISALLTIITLDVTPASSQDTSNPDVRFERNHFTVERYHGMVYFDGVASKHPKTDHALYIDLITAFDGIKLQTDREVLHWVRTLHGKRTYTYDNVIRKDDIGNQTVKPLVLISSEQRLQVDPFWHAWLVAEAESKRVAQQQRIAYELEQSRNAAQQEATNQLVAATQAAANSLAVASGETSLWEIELIPQSSGSHYGYGTQIGAESYLVGHYPTGVTASSGGAYFDIAPTNRKYVRAYGRSSDYAWSQALSTNPDYRTGSIRKLAGY